MSRKGNCWDNAVAESFFKTIKYEYLNRYYFTCSQQLYKSIEKYIRWYNTKRIHSALEYITPLEMELTQNKYKRWLSKFAPNLLGSPFWGNNSSTTSTHRQWEVISIEGDYFRLKGVDSGKTLEVAAGSNSVGANVQQWAYEGTTHQQWEFLSTGDGYFRLKNRDSGKSMRANGTIDGTNVDQTSYDAADNQQWYFTIVSASSTKATTTPSGSTPEDILGNVIKDWKITYPVDKNGNDSSKADDCGDRNNKAHEQSDLTGSISSKYSKYFFVSGDEVVFKGHVGGATTSGSKYPRSEFRQLVGGGDNY